jgi:hypothetical protein
MAGDVDVLISFVYVMEELPNDDTCSADVKGVGFVECWWKKTTRWSREDGDVKGLAVID